MTSSQNSRGLEISVGHGLTQIKLQSHPLLLPLTSGPLVGIAVRAGERQIGGVIRPARGPGDDVINGKGGYPSGP